MSTTPSAEYFAQHQQYRLYHVRRFSRREGKLRYFERLKVKTFPKWWSAAASCF
jgi:hypothetical protein